MRDAIAIVGMACRYPDAASPGDLWENALAQRRAFRRFPAERLRLEDYQADDRRIADRTYASEAAVIEGYAFDRVRYKVAGRSFRSADMAHWLALDIAAQALADAGFPEGEGLPRDTTGVLLGNSLTGEFSRANLMRLRWPYVRRVLAVSLLQEGWSDDKTSAFLRRLEKSYKAPYPPITEETLAGGLSNTIAGRICNHFDLHGGGYTVDGACASSLLAVANSCSALAAGDLDVALAGGVDLSLDPFEVVGFAKTGALTPDEMRVFDEASKGFKPGEGCGWVVLMRHDDARADGRRVLAVIRGWGISSDGAGGITRPEPEGQKLALKRAYRRAGVGIESIGYFEGHGTGTAVGDATELKVVTSLRRESGASSPAVIGSIKANFGHTKAAAGVAGLIKAVKVLEARIFPPHTGLQTPHSSLQGEAPMLRLLHRAESWREPRPFRAAVSAMGFGGINTHLVLEAADSSPRRTLSVHERRLIHSARDAELFLFSARDKETLLSLLAPIASYAVRLSQCELIDLAAQLQRRAGPGLVRASVVASTPGQLHEGLASLLGWLERGIENRLSTRAGLFLGTGSGVPRVGFLFSGQGSPANLDGGALKRCFPEAEELFSRVGLSPDSDGVATEVAQPAIITASIAALKVLEDFGLQGSVGIGHSLGELSALHWAGVVDEDAALRIAAARGRGMADLGDPTGTMVNISADAEETATLMKGTGMVIAGVNSPRDTVVSGAAADADEVERRARAAGISAIRLRVSHAFHSPLIAKAAPSLARALQEETFSAPAKRVISTVTGRAVGPRDDVPDLLVRQVTEPVLFMDALRAAGPDVAVWIEVGPGHVLTTLAGRSSDIPCIAVDAGGPGIDGLMRALGAAFALGVRIDAARLAEERFSRPFPLDWQPLFFASPCESAPVADEAPPEREEVSEKPEKPAADEDFASVEELVRSLVAKRAELPATAVKDSSRLLSDLHLNSISVGELVSEAARKLKVEPPSAPTEYANATVGQVAQALRELGGKRPRARPATVEGIASWVRPFAVHWKQSPRPVGVPAGEGDWTLICDRGHPLRDRLDGARKRLSGRGTIVCIPSMPREDCLGRFLEAASAAAGNASHHVVVVQSGQGGAGFAKTYYLEHPHCHVAVVDVPFDAADAAEWVLCETAPHGFVEARYDASGVRRTPFLKLLSLENAEEPPESAALVREDVVLVTGGGKGIAAECAASIAERYGCALILMGRSDPGEDVDLAENLGRLESRGVRFVYVRGDVTSADSAAQAVREGEQAMGLVTALLHGAGINRPQLLATLSEADFRQTVATKVTGLDNVLSVLDPERLRLLIGFASVIGRTGLAGEADYATANEWLSSRIERYHAEHPLCRCLSLEWSVWSGLGMGERLGSIDSLVRQGIMPIPPDEGVEMLHRLLRSQTPVTVVVSGRFADSATMGLERVELPLWRFLERPRVLVPGVELVVDSELSEETDPYLAEHVFRGERLFPAVMGLEAMAQTARALTGSDRSPIFEEVRFHRPVVAPAGGRVQIRVAALRQSPDTVAVALRSESSGFKIDHFQATIRFAGHADKKSWRPLVGADLNGSGMLPMDTVADLYATILFHDGRFRRLRGYRSLRATECLAEILPDGAVDWFGGYLPRDLVLGDPGARDAAIHGIQACIPHATILPLGIERLESHGLQFDQPCVVAAKERFREGDTLVYDVEVLTLGGKLREKWTGLKLRVVDRSKAPEIWPLPLLSTYLERRLQELIPEGRIRTAIERTPEIERPMRSNLLIRKVAGNGARVRRRPDGKPEIAGGPDVSVSHAGDLVFAVAGEGPIGCDVEPVVAREDEAWSDLLGSGRCELTQIIARERDEDRQASATRVWAAGECLRKAGAMLDAPLVLESVTADGWVILGSGSHRIGTLVASVRDSEAPLAVAVALGRK